LIVRAPKEKFGMEAYHGLRRKEKEIRDPGEMKGILKNT